MPIFEFERISTGERHELFISYDEKLVVLKDTDLKEVFGFPAIVSGVQITNKTDSGWRDVLKKVKKANIDNIMNGH